MSDEQWRQFFLLCNRILGKGHAVAEFSESWCAWTTFERLSRDAGYWTAGLPGTEDVLSTCIGDSGVWGQPFPFQEIAHLIIPKQFYWERIEPGSFANGSKPQDLTRLAQALEGARLPHRVTESVLEVKLY
ncbi:hypothetical protein Mpe_A0695 [Methylibium petroleiphilum PM1]|uniref:Uncharacterized protein n=1 Tax=Methylibium petroleiphilum (strain ATCC BAA-1232 / LMG 22953 / PM1) TaxID=420662 RepID=A2SDL8_METPP|nr:hypothetical protein Mpe_A0695 [Methylibium petroleiphilum PM1]